MIMFFQLCHCDDTIYERVLNIFATEADYVERNTRVRVLLNIPSHREIATAEIEAFARRMYAR